MSESTTATAPAPASALKPTPTPTPTAWIGPVRELPPTTVLGLFEAHAAATPDAPAVTCGEQRLSYAELDTHAEAVAAALRALGLRRGDRVAVCLDRSADLPVALLAVWKAGAVYVPVDLAYPAERVRLLLADSAAAAVLSRSDLAAQLPPGQAPVIALEALPAAVGPVPPGPAAARPDDPAYVVYTSGSTGTPKGVRVGHRALLNVVAELARELDCGPGDRWLAVAAAGFDISLAELGVPLASGAELVLASDAELREPRLLVRLVRERAVTRMQAVPSQWRLLLDAGLDAPALVAMTGGESLGVNLARELRARVAGLFNGYGPTETTVLSTLWRVPPQPEAVSLGRPIANTRLHLLDEALRPVPDGETGELCIAGAGVTDGYPSRPELTAERFVAEPGGAADSLMYRTGDRCRRRADGSLEFVGRADDQVKVNGRRIELGEVEAALSAMPGVAGVAVTAHEGPGGAALVAYLLPEPGAPAPDAAAVRAFGRTRLPAALVPGRVVVLDRFPLTAHGKVDRRALPAPATDPAPHPHPNPHPDPQAEAPADPILAEVSAIVRETLGLPQVHPTDDLADLGATSLTLMQLASRMHARWNRDVPLELFFDNETVAEVAAAVTALLA